MKAGVPGAGDHAPGAGGGAVIIVASVRWMSWMALVNAAFVATRLSMVAFFWMDAFARLSSDVAICCACLISLSSFLPGNYRVITGILPGTSDLGQS